MEDRDTIFVVGQGLGWLLLGLSICAGLYTIALYYAVGRLGARGFVVGWAGGTLTLATVATVAVWARMNPEIEMTTRHVFMTFGLYIALALLGFGGATLALRGPLNTAAASGRLPLSLFAYGIAGFVAAIILAFVAVLMWDVVRLSSRAAA